MDEFLAVGAVLDDDAERVDEGPAKPDVDALANELGSTYALIATSVEAEDAMDGQILAGLIHA